MTKIRWHVAALCGMVTALVLGLVAVAPASGATGVTATFSKSSDWGSGYEGKYTITNGGASAISSWAVEFELPTGHTVGSVWDGTKSTNGSRVTVRNSWNGNVAPGASASFGFNVSYTGASGSPVYCRVDGGACDGTGTTPTTTTPPPVTTTNNPGPGGKINLGYFAQWTVYARNYHVKNIHTSGSAAKLTHINYAFGNVSNGQCVLGDADADTGKFYDANASVDGVSDTWDTGALRGNFNQLRKLKKMYPHIKVLYSFGGWTWSGGFGQAAQNPAAFAESCHKLVEDPRWADVFDGIDIDWEYPNACGLTCDTSGFSSFKNLSQALRTRFGSNYLVTAAITADGSNNGKIDKADYGGAAQYLNWYNVMTYDYFGGFTPQGPTAPHSPLTAYPGIPAEGFNSDAAIQKLKGKGVPSAKLLLGIGFYGRGWTGVTQSAPGGSATGPAPGDQGEAGIADYKTLKTRCPATGTVGGTAYAKCGNEWWSYDTPSTIGGKMNYSKTQGLGGAFFWELSGDTSNGELITSMSNGLK
ncbi:glycosyl hydrolase family 18 protein [Allokutzneria sp. A3M-2-11 16]|uniref:glycosyl hydrolase family 18 protein n=1 Tax=Allokutzneria sp. A3M-2-11 16 TaxID=2962043 RepID=UPI0020B8FCB7|nr:glycosyl hydrolase family 18 protein [Allokutzneria sp. A3M-2-11 16]MCP3804134.1 glycosyl hydrolase family 18 protein [Allokutzneria sp. A3M-2-11 16]